jgi:uncharacterized protein GlcG (DUF336 family)/ABC-type molybdate transport system substrate-binding protein
MSRTKRSFLRGALAAGLALVFSTPAAFAADITVFTSGVTNGGIYKLAVAWMVETGNNVKFKSGAIGDIEKFAETDIPGDVVLLPPDDMAAISKKLRPGTVMPIGKALFGLSVKQGGAHPDISTVSKFAAALKASGGIGYPDPTGSSLSGKMVDKMLDRPEFRNVVKKPQHENASLVVLNGHAPFGAGTISEELAPGVEVVGAFPASLNMQITFEGAVLSRSRSPDDALSFLRYISSQQAGSSWHDCGIDTEGQDANAPRNPCAVAAPTIVAPPSNEEARLPRAIRATGIPLDLAMAGVSTAVANCLRAGYKVSALVVDSAGVPIALATGDGAAAITQRIAMGKAQTVIKYKMTSGQAAEKAARDEAFMASLLTDPQVGPPRQGGIPIVVGEKMLGAIAVSGAPTGDKDEPCAIAGLGRIQGGL